MDTIYNKHELKSIFDIVENFIIDNKLIVYGGMAVDFLLKSRGDIGLYTENDIPDYDIYTPNISSAYNLADEIFKSFKNVCVINAIHLTTLRVRCFGIYVADFSYVPSDIFDKIETFDIHRKRGKFNIAGEMILLADIHRSFLSPFRGNCILNRIPKNVCRLKKITETNPGLINYTEINSGTLEVQSLKNNNLMFGGFIAYCFYMATYGYMKHTIKNEIHIFTYGKQNNATNNITDKIIIKSVDEKLDGINYIAPMLEDYIPKSMLLKDSLIEVHEYNSEVGYNILLNENVLDLNGVMLFFLSKHMMGFEGYLDLYKNCLWLMEKHELSLSLKMFGDIDPIENTIRLKFLENKRDNINEQIWPFINYNPRYDKVHPSSEGNLYSLIGMESIDSFDIYEHVKF